MERIGTEIRGFIMKKKVGGIGIETNQKLTKQFLKDILLKQFGNMIGKIVMIRKI